MHHNYIFIGPQSAGSFRDPGDRLPRYRCERSSSSIHALAASIDGRILYR